MICFTICANNYLAEALTLGDSLLANNLSIIDYKIFLIDKKRTEIDYKKLRFEINEVDQNMVFDFEIMVDEYKIVELSTAIKPSIFKYLMQNNKNENVFVYLDPDLFFYNSVEYIEKELERKSILITPHITKPLSLQSDPFENTFLNYGLYNLGFIALKNDANSEAFINWWEERTLKLGYDDVQKGLFVDQLWINLVPLFFRNVKISFNIGFNVSYWNIHERKILILHEKYYVVDKSIPLIFYHFSSFDFDCLSISKRGNNVANFEKFWQIMSTNYKEKLIDNNYKLFKNIKPFYKIKMENYINRYLPQKHLTTSRLKLLKILRKILPFSILRKISNLYNTLNVIDRYKSTL